MKITFAVACLLSGSNAVKLSNNGPWEWDSSKTPWDRDTLPDCPADTGRTIMDDGKTHVSKYPNVGATCKMQVGESSLIMFVDESKIQTTSEEPPHGAPVDSLPHCPDFDERMTLTDGRTKAVAYPGIGYNCKADYQLQEKKQSLAQNDPNWGPSVNTLEHCPDFDERFTLANGQTRAVPYPQVGYNCSPSYQMIQKLNLQQKSDPNWGPSVNTLQHCPDFSERFTLVDGQTRAVPYPQVGFNCKQDYQLMQKGKRDPPHGPPVSSLPHCPDFNERFTLVDGQTRAVPYPQIGYNCQADYQLQQKQDKKKDVTEAGVPVDQLEHCPDFDERFTLVDGKTRAIPYPQKGANCNPEWQLNKKQPKEGQLEIMHLGI